MGPLDEEGNQGSSQGTEPNGLRWDLGWIGREGEEGIGSKDNRKVGKGGI